MKPHNIIECLKKNKAAINGWLTLPCPFTAEIMANQGYDTLTIDMQHGVIDYEIALSMLQAIATTSTTPIVRVPWLEPGIIMKMLDAGAYGIVCPMIQGPQDTQSLVKACKYPPKGFRSFGPLRASLCNGNDYPEKANDTIMPIAMIETRTALESLEDILSVEGLGGLYIGPFDLSYALGCTPRPDDYEQPVLDAIDRVLTKAAQHNIPVGIHCITPEYANRMINKGFNWVTVACDSDFIKSGSAYVMNTLNN
ncbi:aldolase/citrate lyase family protein [Endozoicomonas sp. Mp262]|uniref:HpcH/HpaI aldolase family protein n=1 Tax=Endozoicomonas sp. Mp262 TaxID=2919499 RepID=UPI0021D8807C